VPSRSRCSRRSGSMARRAGPWSRAGAALAAALAVVVWLAAGHAPERWWSVAALVALGGLLVAPGPGYGRPRPGWSRRSSLRSVSSWGTWCAAAARARGVLRAAAVRGRAPRRPPATTACSSSRTGRTAFR
jgi:hypothetical protein